jgi:hypothetical protein
METVDALDLTKPQKDAVMTFLNAFDYSVALPLSAPMAYAYLHGCAYKHNCKVRDDLMEIKKRLATLIKQMTPLYLPGLIGGRFGIRSISRVYSTLYGYG